ncbi:fusarubin cluster-esterase [Ophiocordyceps camponoti-floridani]|uniref:Fusarubin cluster-esterase n=1 Tax=Ophiocordyceps camponoti-floridani TaxID=2030778 RepID=A0A8H4Q7F7_9HYPO|nr:fusarubin cluster-esterase [Ophiocordyceps camponoti-floridani]
MAVLAALLLIASVVSVAAESEEASHIRSVFYVGGQYEGDDMVGQMYVERLRPVNGVLQQVPVVLIHGMGMTGSNFLNKPDGSRGWASNFLDQGYEVYIVDQTNRGRSASRLGGRTLISFNVSMVQDRFTATQRHGHWPQARNHSQWPGSGLRGDPIFDAFYAATVPSDPDAVRTQTSMQRAGTALLDIIGVPSVILGHSQGGLFPILMADSRPHLVRALVLLEPSGPPFRDGFTGGFHAWGLSDVPLAYEPVVTDPLRDLVQDVVPAPDAHHSSCILQARKPAPRQLVHLVDKPILVMTSEASYHAPYDYCTVAFLRQAGCRDVEHVELAAVGIRGNGHMMFLERNSPIVTVIHRANRPSVEPEEQKVRGDQCPMAYAASEKWERIPGWQTSKCPFPV